MTVLVAFLGTGKSGLVVLILSILMGQAEKLHAFLHKPNQACPLSSCHSFQ